MWGKKKKAIFKKPTRDIEGDSQSSERTEEQISLWTIRRSLEDEVPAEHLVNNLKLEAHSSDHSRTVLIRVLYRPYVCETTESLAIN